MLAFILDVSRTNGQTIWAINMGIDPRRLKSQEFLWHLILQMVTPHIQRRSLSATFRRTSGIIKSTLEYFLLITKNDRAQCTVGENSHFSVTSQNIFSQSQKYFDTSIIYFLKNIWLQSNLQFSSKLEMSISFK